MERQFCGGAGSYRFDIHPGKVALRDDQGTTPRYNPGGRDAPLPASPLVHAAAGSLPYGASDPRAVAAAGSRVAEYSLV